MNEFTLSKDEILIEPKDCVNIVSKIWNNINTFDKLFQVSIDIYGPGFVLFLVHPENAYLKLEKEWTSRFLFLEFAQTSKKKGAHHVHQPLVSWIRYPRLSVPSYTFPKGPSDFHGQKETLERQVLKGTRWLLLKNPENLDPDPEKREKERLQQALELNVPLAKAYYRKDELREF